MRKLLALPFAIAAVAAPSAEAAAPTFAEAYKTILDRSLRVRTQMLDVEASEIRRNAKYGAFTPSLAVEGTQTTTAEPVVGPKQAAGLAASVNLFRSFSDLAGLQAAKKSLERSQESLLNERQKAEAEAATAIFLFIARTRQRQISERIVGLKSESLKIARERYDKGLMPLQEVDKVAIELENSRAFLTDAVSAEAAAKASLQTLLGDDAVAVDWPWRQSLSQGAKLETIDFAIERRPDFRALQAGLESDRLRKREALGAFLPSLDFEVAYGSFDLSQPARRDWSTILRLKLPLYDGYKSISAYRLVAVSELATAVQLESLKRSAPAEVEGFRQSHKAARETALAREKTALITERLYSDNLQRFRLGRASANDLALDQTRLLDSQNLEVSGWSDAHISFVQLCHALGGYVEPSGQCRKDAPPVPGR